MSVHKPGMWGSPSPDTSGVTWRCSRGERGRAQREPQVWRLQGGRGGPAGGWVVAGRPQGPSPAVVQPSSSAGRSELGALQAHGGGPHGCQVGSSSRLVV